MATIRSLMARMSHGTEAARVLDIHHSIYIPLQEHQLCT